jgi:sulfate permease, SulP family
MMTMPLKFNRMEFAGSLGDLGTLLPLAVGMILINGLHPDGVFFCIGVFYILSGLFFGVTTPVQPMKVIGAYAVATSLSASQIMAASLLMAILLVIIGVSGVIDWLARRIPKAVIRGIQFSTGLLLMAQGVKCMVGTSSLQLLEKSVEPYLRFQSIGPVAIGIPLGIVGVALTLFLLNNRKLPASLAVIGLGLFVGIVIGTHQGFESFGIQVGLTPLLPFGLPDKLDFTFVFFALVLPQTPMTVGNAVLANADLANTYFGAEARRVTGKALCISMALANAMAFLFGGIPMCHGAGGLAAHYRFGARTAGSNLMIGGLMLLAALLFSDHLMALFHLIPFAVLGVLLLFAGGQLALTIIDLETRSELFVCVVMLGVTLATNLAYAFCAGLLLFWIIRRQNLDV